MRNISVKLTVIIVINLLLSINLFARLPLLNASIKNDEATSSSTLNMYSQVGQSVPLEGNTNQLSKFKNDLSNAGSKKIRVGHFGDSLIWGDVITLSIRDILQERYGGKGLGFISICNDDLMIRRNIEHKFSDDWDWGSVFTKNTNRYPLHINGIVSTPANNSWVSYRVESRENYFNEITILYSDTKNSSSVIVESEEGRVELNLPSNGKDLEELKHNFNSEIAEVKLTFKNCEGAFVYGVNLENGSGVYVDNFAMRGNSGISLKALDKGILKDISTDMNYRLFILNFGINAVESGKTDHTFYKKMMSRIIESYRRKFPDASFVVISAGDRAIKKGSRLVSDEFVPILVQAQKELAEDAGVAFWNLYEAMGGEGSMVEWVEKGFANKDYIHLNDNGGRIVAELFLEALFGS